MSARIDSINAHRSAARTPLRQEAHTLAPSAGSPSLTTTATAVWSRKSTKIPTPCNYRTSEGAACYDEYVSRFIPPMLAPALKIRVVSRPALLAEPVSVPR